MKYAKIVETRDSGKITLQVVSGKKGKGKVLHTEICNDNDNYSLGVADRNITLWLKTNSYIPVFIQKYGMVLIDYYMSY